MALNLADRLNYKLRSCWKLCLSIRKRDWELSDYPVVVHKNRAIPAPVGQRYFASILNWGVAAAGESETQALQALERAFAKVKAQRVSDGSPLPRPGTRVPVEFASQNCISAHSELAEDFVHRVLNLDWAWISDESTLWDFHHNETHSALIDKINEVYGVDVSDIQSAKLSEILERIAAYQKSS
jgi:predicted RNase H-like HicB family nuclease